MRADDAHRGAELAKDVFFDLVLDDRLLQEIAAGVRRRVHRPQAVERQSLDVLDGFGSEAFVRFFFEEVRQDAAGKLFHVVGEPVSGAFGVFCVNGHLFLFSAVSIPYQDVNFK